MTRTLQLVLSTLAGLGIAVATISMPVRNTTAQTSPSLARGWEHRALGPPAICNYPPPSSIFEGGPGLVAYDGCDMAVWTSADGSSWNQVSLPPLQLDNVNSRTLTVQGQLFVMFGPVISNQPGPEQTDLWVSPDAGTTWHSSSTNLQFRSVTAGGDGPLATADAPPAFNAELWTSADGLTWSHLPDPSGTFQTADVRLLVHGGFGWLASGEVGFGSGPPTPAMWISTDSRKWERVASTGLPTDASIMSLVAGPQAVLAVLAEQNTTRLLVSKDGIRWQQATNVPPGVQYFYFGSSGIASWQGGFIWMANEGGETGVWSSADGLSWERVGGDELFGGTASINDVVSFKGGIAAVGGFAAHPRPACIRTQGADMNDLRGFQTAVFVWNPANSPAAPPAIDRSDPQLSKLLPSDIGTSSRPYAPDNYRTAYVNLCAEEPALGQHRAYRVQFPTSSGSSAAPVTMQGQELTIATQSATAAHTAFLHVRRWMFYGTVPKVSRVSAHIGEQTEAYTFALPSDAVPPGSPYKGYAVVWLHDQTIGEVYTTNLRLAIELAQKQYDRLQNPPVTQLETVKR